MSYKNTHSSRRKGRRVLKSKRREIKRPDNKTYRQNKNIIRLFNKYSQNKNTLTQSQCVKLMKKEFHLNYNIHVINSFMNIWGEKINRRNYILKDTFFKLFEGPNGFFRDITLK